MKERENRGRVGEIKAEEKIETGTPQVREMGKEEGSNWLCTQRWEEGIHTGKNL